MPLVMLKKNWPGTFHRCIRDEKGAIVKTLEFSPGEMLEVAPEDCHAIQSDLGHVLLWGELVDGRFQTRDPKDFHFVASPPAEASGAPDAGTPPQTGESEGTPPADGDTAKAKGGDKSAKAKGGDKSAKVLLNKE